MINPLHKAVAIVGVGAVMPDGPNLPQFWTNIKNGKYSITDVPADRWKKELFYDADRKAPDKAYSTIGGWVKDFDWDPIKWRLPIPPRVGDLMDLTQKYAIAASREALLDFDYENKDFDRERTAVIFGNAMGGDQHLYSAARALFPEYVEALHGAKGFAALPDKVKKEIIEEMNAGFDGTFVPITEDTMPGELSNIAAGRIAALFNLRGMNYVTDAACASAMAGISAAVNGLLAHDYDLVVTGGTDANMSPSTFIKFCKIGALSARDSRPYAKGADGFVMGEGAAVFIMKRLEDAERDGDKIYAVYRSMGGASDGKGKGITAPNPKGQMLAVRRAWERIGLSPASAGLIEGHGTSTTVGDAAELQSMVEVFKEFGLPVGSIALGSVKGNIGHLKGGAGAAGIMKATMALYEKVLPPSLNFEGPNPNVDFNAVPFKVNTELRPWDLNGKEVRRCGVSAFGFGGTNFHAVLEEYVPGKITGEERSHHFMAEVPQKAPLKKPLRGVLVVGRESKAELISGLEELHSKVSDGWMPEKQAPKRKDLDANHRLAIDFNTKEELTDKLNRALKALPENKKGMWKVLNAKGVFYGQGKPGKVAFLFTGQGSQYANMLRKLKEVEPVVEQTFREADRIMTPLLGKSLSDYIFVDANDKEKITRAEEDLKQTEITQPSMLTADTALFRLMKEYGIKPDMVIGHSLGEYGALVASGVMSFTDALLAVSARGHQMAEVKVEDKGMMAAIFASPEKIEKVLKGIDGYVVIANINSSGQSVIGGSTDAVQAAMKASKAKGYHVSSLPVSHAFHTAIVAPASEPLRDVLADFNFKNQAIPIISNVTGEFYPDYEGAKDQVLDLLSKQVASPVQFVKGINNLYDSGARIFVEMGPKKALNGFVRDIMSDRDDVSNLFTNHPKIGDLESFNQALCGMYAAGLGAGSVEEQKQQPLRVEALQNSSQPPVVSIAPVQNVYQQSEPVMEANREDRYLKLGKMFVDFLEKADQNLHGSGGQRVQKNIWVTGAAMGLPGVKRVFSDDNVARILRGDQFIQVIPRKYQEAMLDKNVTRLIKTGKGGPRFVTIDQIEDVIKLAARKIDLDIVRDFDFPQARMDALDEVSALAIGAGIDALRDAGIPMVMNYKTTSKGSRLPDRYLLPEEMRDNTGIIFASAFPGYNAYASEMTHYFEHKINREKLQTLLDVKSQLTTVNGVGDVLRKINQQIDDLSKYMEENNYVFDRRFLFRVLSMGHSQFAEYIGARGPNVSVNAACASTTQAVGIAKDWIEAGRCDRVLLIAADDITGDHTLEWFASGFIATGAAATDERVEDAALPFDKRRHGMIIGMGGASLVIESKEIAERRGIAPIAEVMSTVIANSAYHGTRLDVSHIKHVMEKLISDAEKQWGIDRSRIAPQTVFISHETYTPARGGSAAAEIEALNYVFKSEASKIVIANTKGFTGHPMAVGIEDILAIKTLETGIVPPVANFKEVDPGLGDLNLSKGGSYPIQFALRLAAGFGSQISMTLYKWSPTPDGQRRAPNQLGFSYRIKDRQKWEQWLRDISGKENPELEVYKRTLRIKDAFVPNGTNDKPSNQEDFSENVATLENETVHAAIESRQDSTDLVRDDILQLIAEKTGYPTDMLDVDLDLEADLGIDTVKQAELFADIREKYAIGQDDDIDLTAFPTLNHIIGFVYDKRPDLKREEVEIKAAVQQEVVQAVETKVSTSVLTGGNDQVVKEILSLIAEKTGYPPEMLDLDLDLEADLGIDTVKQAELFADIREKYGIAQDDDIDLTAFPTLNHIIGFVYDKRPDLKRGEVANETPLQPEALFAEPKVSTATPDVARDKVAEEILSLIAEKTGYPPEMLDLDLDLEADLGIDTVKQAELFADIREKYAIGQEEDIDLSAFPTLNHIIAFVYDKKPALKNDGNDIQSKGQEIKENVEKTNEIKGDFDAISQIPRRAPVPVLRPGLELCKSTGVVLDENSRIIVKSDEGKIGEVLVKILKSLKVELLLIEGNPSAEKLDEKLKNWTEEGNIQGVFWLSALDKEEEISKISYEGWKEATHSRIKLLYHTMRQLELMNQSGLFLVSATRMGGKFGYDEKGAYAPLGGAVSGFTKAYKRENPESLVKVVDFESSRKTRAFAELLIQESLFDNGAVEIGYKNGFRWTIGLKEQEQLAGTAGMALNNESVYVITGGAGSIVSAITADLARANGGIYYLLDLTPEPNKKDSDTMKFVSDPAGLKRDLFARLKESGEKATPVLVEKLMAGIERKHAALSAINAIENAGGKVYYHAVNLLDNKAVTEVMKTIMSQVGKIDVLLHAGGLEISRMLKDKSPQEFNLVFDVKADGWYNILSALGDFPIGATVVFSSIAGRFGNGGQVDYSAANDFLCKSTSSFKTLRKDTRGIALDWTAWGGIGMAARGSIPMVMKQAGIDMLPPEAGIPFIRKELIAGTEAVEIVVAQSLGLMLKEFDANGGIDLSKANQSLLNGQLMIDEVLEMGLYSGMTVSVELDPKEQGFLFDHEINGVAVLPGVMGIEAMSSAAALMLPGYFIRSVEQIEFMSPFKFYKSEPRKVFVQLQYTMEGNSIIADVELFGLRKLLGQDEAQKTVHFKCRVRLSDKRIDRITDLEKSKIKPGKNTIILNDKEIYKIYFHGPAYQVIDKSWSKNGSIITAFSNDLPTNHSPEHKKLMVMPRLIELCFQTAGIQELGKNGVMGLPAYVEHFVVYQPWNGKKKLYAVVHKSGDGYDAYIVDMQGNIYMELQGYQTAELPGIIDKTLLKPLKQVFDRQ